MLRRNEVILSERRTVTTDDVASYIYQKPNRTMLFGMRFYLGLYNLAGKDTTKWVNRTLRNWGEPPVIYDSTSVKSSIENIEQYLRTLGFYYAQVYDSVTYKKKKAYVHYIVNPNKPYRLGEITYNIADTTIRKLVLASNASTELRTNRRLADEVLEGERDRITSLLRNNGYFAFNKGFITYEADTSVGNLKADLVLKIANITAIDTTDITKRVEGNHKIYRVNKVFVYTDFDPVEVYTNPNYLQKFDTIYKKNVYFLHSKGLSLRPEVILRTSLIIPGKLYNESDASQTYNNFLGLRLFKSVTIQFRETSEVDSEGNPLIDCVIQMSQLKSQALKADFELSLNSAGLIGFSPGLQYNHRNLFKGAEQFSLNFRGVSQRGFTNLSVPQTSFEYNIATSISFPKFLAPIRVNYLKKQMPQTRFTASYTYQRRPDFTRSIGALTAGYSWNNSPKLSFIYNPVDFNMVKMLSLDSAFYKRLTNPFLRNTYSDHFILGMTSSIIYSNQSQIFDFMVKRARRNDTYFFRFNLDLAGNVLSAFNSLMDKDSTNQYRVILDTRYAQFVRFDVTFAYNKPIKSRSSLAYRLFFGLGKPYGNSISLPFERMFAAGGANSLRGWLIRDVGPGSAQRDTAFIIPNQVADMRIEANIEYRFPLFWRFEGATFLDAGNIWSISPQDPRPGAKFTRHFYKEIAANTGLGLRLNFVYFILRLDAGFRIHDPVRKEGDRFVPPNKWLTGDNYAFHISINYPF